MVTATLPPFRRPADRCHRSSIGNAKSLRAVPGHDAAQGRRRQRYAMAQGNVVVVGAGASGAGLKVTVNHLFSGRIAGGATVRREVPTPVGQGEYVHYELNANRFQHRAKDRRRHQPEPSRARRQWRWTVARRGARRWMPTSGCVSGRLARSNRAGQSARQGDRQPRTGSVVMNQMVLDRELRGCARQSDGFGDRRRTRSASPGALGRSDRRRQQCPDRHQAGWCHSRQPAQRRQPGRRVKALEFHRRQPAGPDRDPSGHEDGRRLARRAGNHLRFSRLFGRSSRRLSVRSSSHP